MLTGTMAAAALVAVAASLGAAIALLIVQGVTRRQDRARRIRERLA